MTRNKDTPAQYQHFQDFNHLEKLLEVVRYGHNIADGIISGLGLMATTEKDIRISPW